MEKIKPEDFKKAYKLFDQRIEQSNSNLRRSFWAIVFCLILFLLPKIVFCQTINIENTKTGINEQAKTQEQQRQTFTLFNSLFSGGNITRIQGDTNSNNVGYLYNDFLKEELEKLSDSYSKLSASIEDLTKVNENLRTNVPATFTNSFLPTYSPKIHFPKFHFPKEIVVKMNSSNASSATDLNAREIALLNQSIKELKDDYKELESSIPHFDWSKNYICVLSFMAFFGALLYIVLYLSRLLRYYLKLKHHYKDRKLAFQLNEELKIPVEEAMMIISSSHIDFTVPKMPYDLLANYYNNKNQTDCPCCCRCCSKCVTS